MALVNILVVLAMVSCALAQPPPGRGPPGGPPGQQRDETCDGDNGPSLVEAIERLADTTADQATMDRIASTDDDVELDVASQLPVCPSYRCRNPCPTRSYVTSPRYAVNAAGILVRIIWPPYLHIVECDPNGDQCKCAGKCVQKYKYEVAIVVSYGLCPRVYYWDWIRVKSGCCCHYYERY